eukprot:4395178-Amphidinium_carterae.1
MRHLHSPQSQRCCKQVWARSTRCGASSPPHRSECQALGRDLAATILRPKRCVDADCPMVNDSSLATF